MKILKYLNKILSCVCDFTVNYVIVFIAYSLIVLTVLTII